MMDVSISPPLGPRGPPGAFLGRLAAATVARMLAASIQILYV